MNIEENMGVVSEPKWFSEFSFRIGDIVSCKTKSWETKPMILKEMRPSKKGWLAVCQDFQLMKGKDEPIIVPHGDSVLFPASGIRKVILKEKPEKKHMEIKHITREEKSNT